MLHSTVRVELLEVHFESVDWAVSFKNATTKEKVSGKLSNYDVLEAWLRKLLSDTFSKKE